MKMRDLRQVLTELFAECEHGDAEHRKWLKDKFNDFADRKDKELIEHLKKCREESFVRLTPTVV